MTSEKRIAALSPEEQGELLASLREAVFHLTSCWDALWDAEGIVESDIETDDISGIAGNIGEPSEAYQISMEDFLISLHGEDDDESEE